MVGIAESVDLNITAALAKVKEIGVALDKATTSTVKTVGGAGVGARAVEGEAVAATAGVSNLAAAATHARGELGALASTASGTVSPALGQMGGIVTKLGSALAGPQGLAVGAAAATIALGVLALKGVGELTKLAGQVRTVQRATGATAEDSSRLVAVGNALGVSAESQAAAFFRLSRNLNEHADKLREDGIVAAKTKTGQIDLSGTLLNVADAYQKAGRGAAGNKILFDAFGRSGLALAPILSKNREELQFFFEEAAKHHEILSQADLDKAYQFKIATHALSEAFAGLERELGVAIIPLLTTFAQTMTSLIEIVDRLGGVVAKLGVPFGGFGRLIGGLIKEVNPLAFGMDVLRGHFAGAARDVVPFGNTVYNVATRNREAKKPTDDLADAISELGDAAAAAAPKLTAGELAVADLKKTLAGSLDGYVTVQRAQEAVRSSTSSLAEALRQGAQKGETHAAFLARLRSANLDVIGAVEAHLQEQVRLGSVSGTTGQIQDILRQRLLAVAAAFPSLRAEIAATIGSFAALNGATAIGFGVARTDSRIPRSALPGPPVDPFADQLKQLLANGVKAGTAAGAVVGKATGAAAKKAVEVTLRNSAQAGQGIDVGGFIVAGFDVAQKVKDVLARNASLGVGGLQGVVRDAAKISLSEQDQILTAVAAVDQASKDLADTRKKLGVRSIEAAQAEVKLKLAQETATKAIVDARDATSAYNDALAKVNDGISTMTGSLRALDAVRKAQQSARDAQAEAKKQVAGVAEFDAAISEAKRNLALAGDPITARRAQDALDDLTRRRGGQVQKAADATANANSANLDLVDAEVQLIELGTKVNQAKTVWETYFRSIATEAGLSKKAVDDLAKAVANAGRAAQLANVHVGGSRANVAPAAPNVAGYATNPRTNEGLRTPVTAAVVHNYDIKAVTPVATAAEILAEQRATELMNA